MTVDEPYSLEEPALADAGPRGGLAAHPRRHSGGAARGAGAGARVSHARRARRPAAQLQLLLEHRGRVRPHPAPQDPVPLSRVPHQPLHRALLPRVPRRARSRRPERQVNAPLDPRGLTATNPTRELGILSHLN